MPQTPKCTVISVGTLPEVVSLREAVLKSVGYEVFSTASSEEALSRIRSGDCGVFLLCYSVRDRCRAQLVREFREKCPRGRIVAITNSKIDQVPEEVDQLVFGIEGAEALIRAVKGKAA
jgi:DNA-binding NarL/FixJ family response regulator